MDLLSISNQRMHLPLLDEFQNAAEEFGIPKTKILIQVTIMVVVIIKLQKKMALDVVLQLVI